MELKTFCCKQQRSNNIIQVLKSSMKKTVMWQCECVCLWCVQSVWACTHACVCVVCICEPPFILLISVFLPNISTLINKTVFQPSCLASYSLFMSPEGGMRKTPPCNTTNKTSSQHEAIKLLGYQVICGFLLCGG